jgi:hypothetical protein
MEIGSHANPPVELVPGSAPGTIAMRLFDN